MNCVLSKVFEKHKNWLEIVESFNVNKDTAADIVSEMYINVSNHLEKKGTSIIYDKDEINYYFIYVTLRNLVFDLKRREKKVKYVGVEYIEDAGLEDYVETPDTYSKIKAINDWYENPEYLKMLENETKLESFTTEKMHIYYLRRIFKEVFIDKKKLMQFSRESKITYWSLRNTIKIIKKQINLEYEDRDITRDDF
tara:strand:- start:2944 stop:3531 length:588 start_codon:yes stop_codon:yes gene_type:complete